MIRLPPRTTLTVPLFPDTTLFRSVRRGTDDTVEDSWNRPQLRACALGQSLRLWLLGADRLKYPMIRKHWEPGGGNKALRGRDEWIRIRDRKSTRLNSSH